MSKVNECRKEISSFTQEEDEKFSESWERFQESWLSSLHMDTRSGDSCNSSTKDWLNPTVVWSSQW